ncbi:hypothetical protein K1T71_010562 [Dendrolimus kikuchii]|uniref:Uncharacterized protein n=1 Tax=Dendrolimus kikuchii TaxID=765133 RepID=A0ACC1CPI3_9NEOP|nr:hypothetical protein K1T71_010562 [Dendrolimus kikuchii]
MYITVITIIILEVSSEWVEISQQHYRKPSNSQTSRKQIDKYIEETTYSNQSVIDYNWKDSIHRKQSTNNIRLLNFPTSNLYQTSTGETFTMETIDTSELSDEFGFTEETPFIKKDYGSIEKISNMGSVERVQLTKSPVRSPNRKQSGASIDSPPAGFQNVRQTNNPYVGEDIHFENVLIQDTGKTIKPIYNKEEDTLEYKKLSKPKRYPNTDKSTVSAYIRSTIVPPMTTRFRNQYSTSYFKNKQHNKNNFVTVKDRPHYDDNDIRKQSNTAYASVEIKDNIDTTMPSLDVKKKYTSKSNLKSADKPSFNSKVNNTKAKETENEKQDNAVDNVMKFMKVVADTISKNTRRSVGSKTRYLEDLKETILTNIADRIDAAWPDDEHPKRAPSTRQSRSADATARGHVEFPSSESSLMTISFLTFAVFLIKLVLQIIQTYKHKTMMVAPLVVAAAGRAALKKMQSLENVHNLNP